MKTLSVVLLLALASAASAQEAMYTAAATMPSPGVSVVRPQFNYLKFGTNPEDGTQSTDRYQLVTSFQTGIARAWSLTIDFGAAFEDSENAAGNNHLDKGIEDIDLYLKYRFYKNDTGGIDTIRAAVMFGAEFPSGDDADFSSDSVDPHAGVVLTMVRGRHGFNQEIDFRLNTNGAGVDNNGGGEGPSDALRFNSAYLYRIIPDRFTSTSTGAWYITAEMNGIYETNGDTELRWSPGLMYEGTEFAFELMAQFPLYKDLHHRAELDLAIGVGIRLTF